MESDNADNGFVVAKYHYYDHHHIENRLRSWFIENAYLVEASDSKKHFG